MTVSLRVALNTFICSFFPLSALCSCEHLPAPQRGRNLCQVCPQMALRCSHRKLHALLVRRLRWKRQPLWDTRAVSEGVWETRYTSSLACGFLPLIISEIKPRRNRLVCFTLGTWWILKQRSCSFICSFASVGTFAALPVWTRVNGIFWVLYYSYIK